MICKDAEQFLSRCDCWLRARLDLHYSLYLSARLIARRSPIFEGPYWYGVVEDDNSNVVACGCYNVPNGLLMSEAPEPMLDQVARSVTGTIGRPHRVMAPQRTAHYLVEQISELKDVATQFEARWNTYRLDGANSPQGDVQGLLRKGREKEADLVAQWGQNFGDEQPAPVDVSEFMVRKLAEGDLYVWEDEGAKSVLSLSGPVGNGIRITGVYTPPEFRGRGYASSAVSALSVDQLRKGRDFVVLSVIAGSRAEPMYKKIGFRFIGSKDCFSVGA